MAGMSPDYGPRWVVESLEKVLLPWNTVFEYWTGLGANALYLKEKWYLVETQDVSDKMIAEFLSITMKRGLEIPILNCAAQDHIPSWTYDAFVCTYMLHFLPKEDALKVIRNMQTYARCWGFNALEIFTSETSQARPDRFYPTQEVLLELYPWWKICDLHLWKGMNLESNYSVKMRILLQKPEEVDTISHVIKKTTIGTSENMIKM